MLPFVFTDHLMVFSPHILYIIYITSEFQEGQRWTGGEGRGNWQGSAHNLITKINGEKSREDGTKGRKAETIKRKNETSVMN